MQCQLLEEETYHLYQVLGVGSVSFSKRMQHVNTKRDQCQSLPLGFFIIVHVLGDLIGFCLSVVGFFFIFGKDELVNEGGHNRRGEGSSTWNTMQPRATQCQLPTRVHTRTFNCAMRCSQNVSHVLTRLIEYSRSFERERNSS